MQNQKTLPSQSLNPEIHLGHFGIVAACLAVIVCLTYIKQPQLISLHPTRKAVSGSQNVKELPRYYAYSVPAEDLGQVAGEQTNGNSGVSILNEDGSVSSLGEDLGSVLGLVTEGVSLDYNSVNLPNIVPDTKENIEDYILKTAEIENNYINTADFESALSSGQQPLIDLQAGKLDTIVRELEAMKVPTSFSQLQKLKVIQYKAAKETLTNFTLADENPELVGSTLTMFLKAQQDLETEQAAVAEKFNMSPYDL